MYCSFKCDRRVESDFCSRCAIGPKIILQAILYWYVTVSSPHEIFSRCWNTASIKWNIGPFWFRAGAILENHI